MEEIQKNEETLKVEIEKLKGLNESFEKSEGEIKSVEKEILLLSGFLCCFTHFCFIYNIDIFKK